MGGCDSGPARGRGAVRQGRGDESCREQQGSERGHDLQSSEPQQEPTEKHHNTHQS